MTDHITTLFRLTGEIQTLDEVQGWIDHARIATRAMPRVQLELDRQQNAIDHKRFMIAAVMADIRNRN